MQRRTILFDRRATTAVEFALVMPVFLLLLFGTIEYGRMIWSWQAIQAAAGVTARCVAIGSDACPSASSYAAAAARGFGVAAPAVTVAQPSVGCGAPSGTIMVRVTLVLAFASPLEGLLPGLGTALRASACYPVSSS